MPLQRTADQSARGSVEELIECPADVKGLQGGGDGGPRGGENGGDFCFRERKERPDDNRIKLSATGLVEPAYSFLVWQASSIRTRRDHGIECIDHADDARHNGNFGALEARRVSLAVERFVMMENI